MIDLRKQIIGSALLILSITAQAQSVWHCSREPALGRGASEQLQAATNKDDFFQISSMSTNIDTIGITLRDLMDVYAGMPVRIGGQALTACFNNDNSPVNKEALTTLGLNTNAMSAMSRKSSIVRSQLVWVSNDDDMMRCIVRNHPAVGYFNDVQESGEFGPCF
jgi:hypothetical protein